MRFTTFTGYTHSTRAGAMAVLAGASVWGLFWIPLRYLDTLGIGGLWALSLVMATGFIPAFIMARRRRELPDLALSDTWYAGLALGLAMTLYFVALLYTDVIRVIFLFYLLPVWTTISARIIYGEAISPGRISVMLVALFGLWLLLGGGSSFPIPNSLGDWCAIASGLCWGVSLSLLRGRERGGAFSRTLVAIGAGLVFSLVSALLLSGQKAYRLQQSPCPVTLVAQMASRSSWWQLRSAYWQYFPLCLPRYGGPGALRHLRQPC